MRHLLLLPPLALLVAGCVEWAAGDPRPGQYVATIASDRAGKGRGVHCSATFAVAPACAPGRDSLPLGGSVVVTVAQVTSDTWLLRIPWTSPEAPHTTSLDIRFRQNPNSGDIFDSHGLKPRYSVDDTGPPAVQIDGALCGSIDGGGEVELLRTLTVDGVACSDTFELSW